jgi:glutamate-1-semialdehyde 2,1-aminomutase
MPARIPRTTMYRSPCSRSSLLQAHASRVMGCGIMPPAYPVFIKSGRGCRVVDADGEERIDFVNNLTANILGHSDPDVVEAARRQLGEGIAFSMPTVAETQLAALLVERVRHIDRVRFCDSEAEAATLALEAAGLCTGKTKVARFEGIGRGPWDRAVTGGAPDVLLPWNDASACDDLIQQHRQTLAAVIFDPLPLDIGLVGPKPGFLKDLREMTSRHGVLLISDEVVSFRLGYRGALAETGVVPDLTTFGKIIGGGFPVGAVGAQHHVMDVLDSKAGPGGLDPVTACAGFAQMRKMTAENFARLDTMGGHIRAGIAKNLAAQGTAAQVLGKGSLFAVHLTDRELLDHRAVAETARNAEFLFELCHEMLGRGIAMAQNGMFGCLSLAMTTAELDSFISAFGDSLAQMDL